MEVTKREFSVLSSDGIHKLAGVIFAPEGEARGYFHIVHGMTEHMERYERFMRDMAAEGYICFGYDHLGHGKTAADETELGYIAPKDGWKLLVKDVKVFSDAVRAEYGRKGKPYYLLGHSMGSFIARLAAVSGLCPDKLIVMGTGGANPAAGAGLALISVISRVKGDKHISKLIDNMAFGSYNDRFKSELEIAPSPWLTTDVEIRKKYAADPFCRYKFTVSAMGDLIRVMKYSNDAPWYERVSKDMPVLLVSGKEDPVGNYGKGVEQVRDGLSAKGVSVECILYDGARHEILNDFTYETVKADILDFISE